MLLELAVGDAYGAGFEYADWHHVKLHNDLGGYVKHPRHVVKPGYYTDDTQMSLAIAELMIEDVSWTAEHIAHKFVEVFKRDPRKGYAGGFYKLLKQVSDGSELLAQLRSRSDKSGAAMRAAPIGFLSSVAEVTEKCRIQAEITHATPEGTNAARAAALLSHYFIYRLGPKDNVGHFLESHVPGHWSKFWTSSVGSQGSMSVRAAITAIVRNSSMSGLLRSCIAFCGDVDTVAAIAMAAGAHCDEIDQDVPHNLVKRLENGTYGRDYLCGVDKRLLAMAKRRH